MGPRARRPQLSDVSSRSFGFRTGRLQLFDSQVSTPKRGSTQRLRMYQMAMTPRIPTISMITSKYSNSNIQYLELCFKDFFRRP